LVILGKFVGQNRHWPKHYYLFAETTLTSTVHAGNWTYSEAYMQKYISKFSDIPSHLMNQNNIANPRRMATTFEGFVVCYQYQCSPQKAKS